jgi:hypothetical protein
MKERGTGVMPDHHIPVYDYKGRLRGRVRAHATSVTVARFINQHGAKLGEKDGHQAWIGPKPPPPKKPKPKFPGMPGAAAAPGAEPAAKPGAPGAKPGGNAALEISLKAAKGSAEPKKAATAK